MMIHKAFILLAVSYISTASAFNLDSVLTSSEGNGNFIIQLNQTACIKHFVPQFIDNAFDIFAKSLGHHHLVKRGNKIVRRDTEQEQVHVFDAYDIGDSFKGITVKFESLDIVKNLVSSFTGHEIVKIIPDQDFHFDLPTSSSSTQKRSLKARDNRAQRVGNFDLDNYEHDKNCPFAPKNNKRSLRKRSTSHKTSKKKTTKKVTKKTTKKSSKRTVKKAAKKTTHKKTTTHKKKTTQKKKITIKKKTTTKKHATTKKHTITKKPTTTKKTSTTKASSASKNVSASSASGKQTNAPWNLVRISQHKKKLTDPYTYEPNAGASAYVYVIDDGMNINHKEFEGRAKWGYSTYSGVSRLGEGHGTHVGGIIGGKTYGVAKKTNLIAVQVLDESGSGSLSSLLAGIQWVSKKAASQKGKAIINMSLGLKTDGSLDSSLTAFDKAVTAVVESGIPVIAASGNWGNNACDVLPAGNPKVFAVGAIDKTDKMADYSSYGKCVSILAPGSAITSAYIDSNTSTKTLSGTSMAAPHAAGVAALFVDKLGKPSPTALYNAMKDASTKSAVSSVVSSTPNKLLFNGQSSD